jgi:serralysin
VDVPGNSSTTVNVTVGSTTNGALELIGDHDWYRITLTAGQSVSISINGLTLIDPYLYIRDQSGNVLFENDDISSGINRNSELAFKAGYSGTYYIDVAAFDDDYSGTYQLSVQPYTPPPLATNDQIATQLVYGYWGGDSHHFNVTQGGTITVNITALTPVGQTLARAALAQWSDIIGVNFQEVTTGGQITFDDGEDGAFTDANWSGGLTSTAHVNVSTQWLTDYGTSLDSYSFQAYVHEIGHALGLGHAGDYNDTARYPYDALFQNDAWSTSIMSYFSQHDNSYFAGLGFSEDYVVTPMIADILGMQTLYGLSTTTRTGDTTYGFNSNAGSLFDANQYPNVAYTIFDSGGTDTLDFSSYSGPQTINLNPETFSNVNGSVGNVSIARGVVIENAVGGSGQDTIIGNGANNVLWGGKGDDKYYVDNVGDQVAENASEGNDTIYSSVSFTLAANIETLRLMGTASINATGNALNNLLVGNSGNNKLDGGAGADKLWGGKGDDSYYVDNVGDQVAEGVGEGNDTVRSSISYVLGDNLETLRLLGTAAINATGNALNNLLVGNSGNNTLDGGTGADKLWGGKGDDNYFVDNAGDQVAEGVGEGTDTVRSSVTFTLGDNIETLRLTGTAAINGVGNSLNNLIVGNSAANSLSGGAGNDRLWGGAGADRLWGGTGADEFAFSNGELGGMTDATAERIRDFSHAQGDYIRLTSYDADSLTAGQQHFTFIGSDAFHNVACELRYEQMNGNTYVTGDTNGDGVADFLILLDGTHNLTGGDFLL